MNAQGRISVPVGIRRKLGVGPGSVSEWDEHESKVVVRARDTPFRRAPLCDSPDVPPLRLQATREPKGLRRLVNRRHHRTEALFGDY
jgi:bifunctional DNA-binding transcriptional regulator/antitoxin component of YhaV-PrlF toxin-antitoxin module